MTLPIMSRIAAAVLSSASVLATVVVTHAAADGNPSAWTVLTKSSQAVTKAGAAYGSGVSTYSVTQKSNAGSQSRVDKGTFSGSASTDTSLRSDIKESISSKQSGVTTTLSIEYATKGQHIATHVTGQKGWHCGNTNKVLNSIDVWTPASYGVSNVTKAQAKKIGMEVWIAGSTTFHGKAVWELMEKVSKTNAKAKASASSTYKYYVDKSDYLVPYLWWNILTSGPSGRSAMVSSVTLSRYGEKLNITMHGC